MVTHELKLNNHSLKFGCTLSNNDSLHTLQLTGAKLATARNQLGILTAC